MEFRIDFFFRIAMDIIYYIVNIALFKILFLHTPIIAGWNEEQMIVFVACYLLVDAVNMTIFSTNMWWLPFYINRGDLDYYLIRPVSPLFFLSLREFSANSFVNLIIATVFFLYAIFSFSGHWEVLNLLVLILLLVNGTLVMYCLQMLMILPVFWTQSTKGFIDLFYALGLAMERPDKIFKGWLRIFFTFIVPFGLIASFPARYFIDGFETNVFVHLAGVSTALWMIVLFLWKKGLKDYASASS
jgi:ABC-2 type transport system permease protein